MKKIKKLYNLRDNIIILYNDLSTKDEYLKHLYINDLAIINNSVKAFNEIFENENLEALDNEAIEQRISILLKIEDFFTKIKNNIDTKINEEKESTHVLTPYELNDIAILIKCNKEAIEKLQPNIKDDIKQSKKVVKITKIKEPKVAKVKVKKDWTKTKKIIITTGSVLAGAIVLTVLLKSCVNRNIEKNNNNNSEVPTTSYSTTVTTSETTENTTKEDVTVKDIDSINIDNDNDNDIRSYIKNLKTVYPELNEYSDNEILDAILLANFTKLNNANIFTNEDEVVDTVNNTGEIITIVGSDRIIIKDSNDDIYLTSNQLNNIITELNHSMDQRKNIGKGYHYIKLTTDSFKSAKTENGYDIYEILEICLNKYEKEGNIEYALIANELMAEFTLNFSINNNAPLSTYYVMSGIYATSGDKLAEDQKLKFSTIYGNGNNDNLGGDICVEELVKYNKPGNQENVFYNTGETFIQDLVNASVQRNR